MKRALLAGLVALVVLGIFTPPDCPAPLVWRKGEGWTWESFGMPVGNTPKEQLEIARQFFEQKDYGNAAAAYRRLLRRWPASFAAEEARFGLAESLSAAGYKFRAFKEYQNLIEKHPNSERYELALQRQFEIGELFMNGYRDKILGVRLFPSTDKAIDIFEQVVKNGPYSALGPPAQWKIGQTYERRKEYVSAVRAYEKLMEKYPNHELAPVAQFQIGLAYRAEAKRAEYDQNAANQAAAAFTDYTVRFPDGERVKEAEQFQSALRVEQARGSFQIGQFYEKNREYQAALIYYNDAIERSPKSEWAASARQKVAALNHRLASSGSAQSVQPTVDP
jgi:outer membrane protein assembly factor BamD